MYLFDKKISWRDITPRNMMLEKDSMTLKIIDYGLWKKEEDSKELVKNLLRGAMMAINQILSVSKNSAIRQEHCDIINTCLNKNSGSREDLISFFDEIFKEFEKDCK